MTERSLKRYFPTITVLLVALVAYLQARGLVQLLALALGGAPERVSSPPPCHDVLPPVATAPKSGQVVIERNPFDSMPGPLRSSSASSAALPQPAARPIFSPPPANPSASLALLRTVRIVPDQKDGRVVGLRLFGIRPSSLLGTLGLKNGDRLESINGFEVSNPEKALEAYARLRTAPRLHLRLDRAGRPLEIDLNII